MAAKNKVIAVNVCKDNNLIFVKNQKPNTGHCTILFTIVVQFSSINWAACEQGALKIQIYL